MIVNTLDLLDRGSRGEVLAITDAPGTGDRLRRIGLREGLIVEVVSNDDPFMIRFDGCCIAIGRTMLRGVTICRCGCEKEDAASQRTAARRAARRGRNA